MSFYGLNFIWLISFRFCLCCPLLTASPPCGTLPKSGLQKVVLRVHKGCISPGPWDLTWEPSYSLTNDWPNPFQFSNWTILVLLFSNWTLHFQWIPIDYFAASCFGVLLMPHCFLCFPPTWALIPSRCYSYGWFLPICFYVEVHRNNCHRNNTHHFCKCCSWVFSFDIQLLLASEPFYSSISSYLSEPPFHSPLWAPPPYPCLQ